MAKQLTPAEEVVRTLDAARQAIENYFKLAKAVGLAAPDGATARGLSGMQLRRRLQAEVIYRLSPNRDALLQLDGAPEARRFVVAHPLVNV
jgi:hypothetical protein